MASALVTRPYVELWSYIRMEYDPGLLMHSSLLFYSLLNFDSFARLCQIPSSKVWLCFLQFPALMIAIRGTAHQSLFSFGVNSHSHAVAFDGGDDVSMFDHLGLRQAMKSSTAGFGWWSMHVARL